MVVDGLTNNTVNKLKRAQAGEFVMPQSVELAKPIAFRCPHCGHNSNLKRVLLMCWPERRREKAGIIVICPACGCRKQVPYVASEGRGATPEPIKGVSSPETGTKIILAALAALLVLAALTIVLLVKLDILQFPEKSDRSRTDTTGISAGQEYLDDIEYPDEPVQEEEQKQSHYEVIQADVTWDEAEEKCEGRVYNGVSGHLAVITSQEEYDAVVTVLNEYISTHPGAEKLYYVWLGAWIDDVDAENYIFNYKWVTGEDWSYENWCSTYSDKGDYIVEPSYYDGDLIENRLILWGYQREKLGWTFSDQNGNLPLVYPASKGEIGFICEYEESESAS